MQDSIAFGTRSENADDTGISKKLMIWTSVSALALCSVMAEPARAQDADQAEATQEEDEDVIVVTGIRENIRSAQEIKRNADTFVDSITAEDIGSLPDRSVTETLQRIPGISISRFAAADDPDHFAVEGAGVVVRGLTYVRSELNGRDVFSANNGRALGFNDVSPELLGAVNVFKQQTADQIEGGLAGVVDLRTRKPFDKRELVLAGSIEANYGDLRKDWTPTYSVYGSNVFSTGIGDIGIALNYSKSELNSRNNGTQVTDYTFRNDVGAGGTVLVPRGAGTRSQDFDRDRESYGGALQWESLDGAARATIEYLRVEATTAWTERSFESTADQGYTTRPAPGTTFEFDENGQFVSGTLAENPDGLNGFQQTAVRRSVDQKTKTEDLSFNLELNPTDRLKFTFDAQYVDATTDNLDFSIFGSTFGNVFVDVGAGSIPDVQFTGPSSAGDMANYFADPANSFYRAAMDHQEDSEGDEFAFRGDVEYDIDDGNFLRKIYAGGRFASREQTTRFSVYNWGVLSEVWTGGGTVTFEEGPEGLTDVFAFPNFQRGDVSMPVSARFVAGDINAGYRDGSLITTLIGINDLGGTPGWRPLAQRANNVDGTIYTLGEINDTKEETFAAYMRLDFGSDDIFGGMRLSGNVGLRYVNTLFQTRGAFQAPSSGDVFSGDCSAPPGPNGPESFCLLSPERQALALAFADGIGIPDTANASYDNWLPSLNLRLGVTNDFLIRFGISRGISRPDLGLTRNFSNPLENINALDASGGNLETGPLFTSNVGNPRLRPIEAINVDLSAEWYFNETGSITLSGFYKDLKNIITAGSEIRSVTNSSGVTVDVLENGSFNNGEGTIKGFELAYNQFYDFLPGPLSGFGFQGNYTYVETSSLPNTNLNPTAVDGTQPAPTIQNLPLQGLSKHNFNAALLYEKYGISARAAYSWRSRYLLTTRDVIFPFSPISHDPTGQLDASIFYTINDHVKVGVQGVNLLNETTVTRSVLSSPDGSGFDELVRVPRSYFTNDRRFTLIARFSF